MGFTLDHTVRFHETDAAGVVYFANGLVMCHGAYEASLQAVGLDLGEFFSPGAVAYPIVHTAMEYCRPMRCGDTVTIHLVPRRLEVSSFEVEYQLYRGESQQVLAQALTRHVCIDTQHRRRQPLSAQMEHWLERWSARSD
ncbi:MAG: acyl-CoA thioesterase [Nodosilinea sp.]